MTGESGLDPEAAYYQAVEEYFVSRRGEPLILSNADWHQVRKWRTAGLPLRVVLRGIRGELPRVELEAVDQGSGIDRLQMAMRDGISEGQDLADPETYVSQRRGLGLGLGAINRMMDELHIDKAAGGGTRIRAVKHQTPPRRSSTVPRTPTDGD